MSFESFSTITGDSQEDIVFERLNSLAKNYEENLGVLIAEMDYGRPSEQELIYLLKTRYSEFVPAIVTNTRNMENYTIYSFFKHEQYSKSNESFFNEIINDVEKDYKIFKDQWNIKNAKLMYGCLHEGESIQMLELDHIVLGVILEVDRENEARKVFHYKNMKNFDEKLWSSRKR